MPRFSAVLALALALISPSAAHAADILVVSDASTDTNIATVLQADGHTVTLVANDYMGGASPALSGDLSAYDCVFWSATVNGFGGLHGSPAVFANLLDYVGNGGRVFVTGYDAIGFPNPMLISFLGGTGAVDYPGSPGAIDAVETSLTTGVVDLRGVVPYQYTFDYDGLTGLAPDTIQVAGSGGFGGGGAQWTLRSFGSGEIAYVSNGDAGLAAPASWTVSAPGASGAYNGAIRNFAAASEGSASTPGAPRVRFTAPYSVDEGAEIAVSIEVTDDEGDTVSFSWDLDGDGAFGESAEQTSVVVPSGTTDGDGDFPIAVEATDGTLVTTRTRRIRIRNVAPAVTSVGPERVSVDQHVRYPLAIVEPAGALDPLTFTVSGPGSVTPMGVYEWMPTETDVTTGGRAPVEVSITIDDGDGGQIVHQWEMSVSPNHAPTAPVAIYPVGIAVLAGAPPRLAVQNGLDLDGDELVYHFLLDSVPTFDSPARQEMRDVPQTSGFTAWTPPNDLPVGRWYWRALADDGIAQSATMEATFLTVPDPEMLPDAGPPDAGVVAPDAGVGPAVDRSCSCRAAGAGAPLGPLASLVLAAIGVAIARRRAS